MMWIPSEIIYNAWNNTDKPIIYETVDAKGNANRKEVDFAVPIKNKYYDSNYEGLCNLCGKPTHGGIPIKKIFSSNYMDWPIHKVPEATHICDACAFCIGMNPVGRITLFRYPVVAERTLHLCNRKQFREFLLNPPEPPFVMILPTSQKKHLFSKSVVSHSKKNYFCNLEEITVPVNPEIRRIVETIEALRGIGFRKTDIEETRVPWNVTKIMGMSDVERMVSVMKKLKSSGMFSLAIEVSQKMNEEESRCYLGLKQKTK